MQAGACPSNPPFQFGYQAGAGYDLVTGIGSIDAKNLVAATAYLEENGLVVPGLVYRLLGFGRTGHLEFIAQRAPRDDAGRPAS